MNIGDKELFNFASRIISPEYYLNAVKMAGISAPSDDLAEHFIRIGSLQDINPHPLFDMSYYKKNHPGTIDPFKDFVEQTSIKNSSPHPLFFLEYYAHAALIEDLTPREIFLHYIDSATSENISPNPMFDVQWYVSTYRPNIGKWGCPLTQYLMEGSKMGYRPHPLFCTNWYATKYISIDDPVQNPLLSHISNNNFERRYPNPFSATVGREERNSADLSYAAEYLSEAIRKALVYFQSDNYSQRDVSNIGFETPEALCAAMEEYLKEVQPVKQRLADRLTFDARRERQIVQTGLSQDKKPSENRSRLSDYLEDSYGKNLENYVSSILDWLRKYEDLQTTEERDRSLAFIVEAIRRKISERKASGALEVSIVIPVYNQIHYTLACIHSILESEAERNIEIIVADDVSADKTPDIIGMLGHPVVLSRRTANSGFLLNCNQSARECTSDYIVLLNNDTIVLPGWLNELLNVFRVYRNVGIAGSKLLSVDGTLQEAGGILWQDGSAWNYGRGGDPSASEYNYLKHADYCSAASVMLPRKVWEEVGGFDTRYAPAYCEDSDIYFQIRSIGYQTVYQPFSEVIHHEGVSHGTDVSKGLKSYQVKNQTSFYEKWGDTLKAENFSNGENVFVARDGSASIKHVLVIDHYVPQYDRDAGSRTMFALIKVLVVAGLQVHFWPDNLHHDKKYTRELQKIGVEVIYGPSYVGRFSDWISTNGDKINYAILSRPHIAINYVEHIREFTKATVLYYGHDLHFARLKEQINSGKSNVDPVEVESIRDLEMRNWIAADTVLYPSEAECEYVQKLIPSKSVRRLTPYAFANVKSQGRRMQRELSTQEAISIIFVGGFNHSPNVDAVRWFAAEIMPQMLSTLPRLKFLVVGSNPPPSITRLESDHVTVFGYVSDSTLSYLYEKADLCVIPLRWGGGVKGKVIEAAFSQVPILTTEFGIQGIDNSQEAFKLCNDASAFAHAVIRLVADVDERQRMSDEAFNFVAKEYSFNAMGRSLMFDIPEISRSLDLLEQQ